jgi:hypothetical protein
MLHIPRQLKWRLKLNLISVSQPIIPTDTTVDILYHTDKKISLSTRERIASAADDSERMQKSGCVSHRPSLSPSADLTCRWCVLVPADEAVETESWLYSHNSVIGRIYYAQAVWRLKDTRLLTDRPVICSQESFITRKLRGKELQKFMTTGESKAYGSCT